MNSYQGITAKNVVLIILVLAFIYPLEVSNAFSRGSSNTSKIGLRIEEGKITADIKDIPLYVVFNEIRERQGLWFEGNKDLLARKVSVKFEDLPLTEGIEKILYPLSYSMVFDSQGVLKGLYIVDSAQSSVIKTDVSNESPTKELLSEISDLEFEQKSEGPPVDPQLLVNSKEIPEFTPVSDDTGPPIDPNKRYAELPEFIPFENDTGPPIDPKKVYKELPEFTPFTSDVGPIDEF